MAQGETRRGPGRPPKTVGWSKFVLRLPPDLHGHFRLFASAQGMSLNDVLVDVIAKGWERVPKRKDYERLAASAKSAKAKK